MIYLLKVFFFFLQKKGCFQDIGGDTAQTLPPVSINLAGGSNLRPHTIDNLKDSRNDPQGLLVKLDSLASKTLLHLIRMPANSLDFEKGGQVEGGYLIADRIITATATGGRLRSVLEEPLHLFRLDFFPAAWLHRPADSLSESCWVLLWWWWWWWRWYGGCLPLLQPLPAPDISCPAKLPFPSPPTLLSPL